MCTLAKWRVVHCCTSSAFGNFTYRLSLSVIVSNSNVAVIISARYTLEHCNIAIVIRTRLATNYCQVRLTSRCIFIQIRNIVWVKLMISRKYMFSRTSIISIYWLNVTLIWHISTKNFLLKSSRYLENLWWQLHTCFIIDYVHRTIIGLSMLHNILF